MLLAYMVTPVTGLYGVAANYYLHGITVTWLLWHCSYWYNELSRCSRSDCVKWYRSDGYDYLHANGNKKYAHD